ncbi:hypothetical protein PybrP1_013159 [[Pythium] brassicae (nom. inval.)]|nr:hypothetical protein PybrP1_013159 [[Pythium] brassicae (nom. inval.)]
MSEAGTRSLVLARAESRRLETEVETVVRLQATDVRDLFPLLAPADPDSRICLLCTATLKDKTHNLTRHLERHHTGALLQLVGQRASAAPTAAGAKAADSKKRARGTTHSKISSSSARADRQSSKRQTVGAAPPARTTNSDNGRESDTDSDDTVAAAAAREEEQTHQLENAKRELVWWLAREQLPIALVESDGFRAFARALNDRFGAVVGDDVRHVLTSLHEDAHKARQPQPHGDGKMRCQPPVVATRALVARSRTSADTCTVRCEQLPCGALQSGYALVRVRVAAATQWDARACRGLVCGRRGVLGRAFVGVVVRAAHPASREDSCSVHEQQRVVLASPSLSSALDRTEDLKRGEQKRAVERARPQYFGVDSPCGALSEYVALPLANLHALPSGVPDDLALLASDAAVALRLGREVQRRGAPRVAIVVDNVAGCVAVLLVRYVHQELGIAPCDIRVVATSSVGPQLQTQLQQFATLVAATEAGSSGHPGSEPLVVDLCGTDASTELAVRMTEPMGTLVLVGRERFEATAPLLAVDMNAVVVNELELVAIGDCVEETAAAVAYLASQASKSEGSAQELRALLTAPVALDSALEQLRSLPLDALQAQHVQVTVSAAAGP